MECKNNVKAIEVQNGKTGEADPRSYRSVFQNKKGDFISDELGLIYFTLGLQGEKVLLPCSWTTRQESVLREENLIMDSWW